MARPNYALNSYTGAATAAVLAGSGIGTTDTALIVSGTNSTWSPLGSNGGFFLTVDYGLPSEEKIFVPSGSWTYTSSPITFSGVTRGVDNTTAVTHISGGYITPVFTSTEASEANFLVSSLVGNGPSPTLNPLTISGNLTVSGFINIGNNNGVIVGNAVTVSGTQNTILGDAINVLGNDNIAIGQTVQAYNTDIAIGNFSVSSGSSIAIGYSAKAYLDAVALGADTSATSSSTAIGFGVTVSGNGSVAIGRDSSGNSVTVLGDNKFVLGTVNHSYVLPGGTFSGTSININPSNYSVGFGDQALHNNTGLENTAVGHAALTNNTNQGGNTAIGFEALYANTGGNSNTAIGRSALTINSSGTNNSALGFYSLYANTMGSNNNALGSYSLSNNTTGNSNVAIGSLALHQLVSGSNNTAVGYNSLNNAGAGEYNTGLGANTQIVGSGNVAIGVNDAGVGATASGLNQIVLGTTSHTVTIPGSLTIDGTTSAPEFSASGLTGATAPSRYVGGTTSGAPATGTFAVGDFVIDQTGKVWVCTTAGTPGTWTVVGPTPATTVTGPDAFGAAAVVGVGTTFARADHDHGLPAAPSSALTNASSSITAVVSLPASTTTTFLTSPSLATGTWLIIGGAAYIPVATVTAEVDVTTYLVMGTAAGSFSISTFNLNFPYNSGNYSIGATWTPVTSIATISSPGTVLLQAQSSAAAYAQSGSNLQFVKIA